MFQCTLVFRRKHFLLKLPSRSLALGQRTLVMGVLNVTPDSFSDGGKYFDPDTAIAGAVEMEASGADLVDIGGESTRPGSLGISVAEELQRVLPVIEGLQGKLRIPISIDTSKADVADAAAAAGAEIVNDVTALRCDLRIAEVVRCRKMGLILMHMRGDPQTMQKKPFARDVMKDVVTDLRKGMSAARRAGVAKSRIVIDPGLGFGKSYEQNFELMAELPKLARLGFPLLAGPSRKSFLGRAVRGAREDERVWGTAAAITACILNGAHIVRVHDVKEMVQVARVADAVLGGD
jgi:dihydropteroate synthase